MQRPLIGGMRAARRRKRRERMFKEEMQIGVRLRSRFLKKVIRHTKDIPNGNIYRKLSKGRKYSWTMI